MTMKKNIFSVVLFLMLSACAFAQRDSVLSVTTAYITPLNTGLALQDEEEDDQFEKGDPSFYKWHQAKKQIHFFVKIRKAGELKLQVQVHNKWAGMPLLVTVGTTTLKVLLPATKKFTNINLGKVSIKDTGFVQITLSVPNKQLRFETAVAGIVLGGTAIENIHYNHKPRRNAASVHLKYPVADSVKTVSFYNEVTIPAGFDPIHTYYMACGFARGYFGIQVNSETERRVIFSVWDAGNEAVDRNKVGAENRVMLLAKGDSVVANDFGNEGTGGHSHFVYPWNTQTTYKFLVTALADSASQTTIYTGYFYLPEQQKWKLIASFSAPKDGKPLRNLYSFSENFVGINGQLERKALFGNQWIQNGVNGQWTELTEARFSYDVTGKMGDRIDYGASVTSNGAFELWHGGFKNATANYGQSFVRPAQQTKPIIDFTKDADSVSQAKRDLAQINAAITARAFDTTGIVGGVYYQILQEGTGDYVRATDTVTVQYKGTLLNDGSIFDQTKEKPARFPLQRLIKGWQIGLAKCRVGGKIKIIIPSGIAYGMRTRSKAIPPNSVLVFDIEVLKAETVK
jgi:FKBP-type peptidyl-prolyl cis-trans isomerase